MSFSELFEHLDPTIAEPLAQAFDRLRRELRQDLGARGDETDAEATGATEAAETPAPAPAPVADDARLGPDPLEELKHAVVQIDSSETQGEILSALLAGARRFSSRAALLLVRPDELALWDANGFEPVSEQLREIRLTPESGSTWDQARTGGGAVPLTRRDCVALTEPAGVEAPSLGVLVPMMLGKRVAALLYADRSEPSASLNLTALQLLTFCAGSVLETLPVRVRGTTASLRLAPLGSDSAAAVPVDDQVDVTTTRKTEPEPEPEPKPEPEPEPQTEPLRSQEIADLDPPVDSPAAEELAPVEVTPSDEPAVAASPPAGFAHEMDFSPPEGIPTISIDSPADTPPEPPSSETTTVERLTEPIPVATEPVESAAPAPEESEPEEMPTLEATPEAEPAAPTGADAMPVIDPTSTVVNPPTDVDGPGWAFTRAPSASSREAQREEARRLARLLVTEIKLYNESQVELGRQNQDLYSRLQEDIDRSRQIFDDRVDPEIGGDEPFFDDALVRILAGGNADSLGK